MTTTTSPTTAAGRALIERHGTAKTGEVVAIEQEAVRDYREALANLLEFPDEPGYIEQARALLTAAAEERKQEADHIWVGNQGVANGGDVKP